MPVLTHAPSAVVRQLVIDLALATDRTADPEGAWPAFATSEPDRPDSVITVYDTVGRDQGRLNGSGDALDQPGVQVRVRATNHPDGHAKASAIRAGLLGVYDQAVTVGANQYLVHAVTRVRQVAALGRDVPSASGRRVLTFDATVCLKQLT